MTSSKENRVRSLVFFGILLVHLVRYVAWLDLDYYPGGDGFYMFMLARSVAYDGDVDMTNDYAICGDPWNLGSDFGTGHPANPYYVGPATVWAPALFVAKHLIPLGAGATALERHACRGPLVYAVGLLGPVFVTLTCYAGYRLARRVASERSALIAAVVIAFGSSLNVFGTLWWNYSHVWAAFALTLAMVATVRAIEAPERVARWLLAGAAIGWAALMRPHHAFWMLTPALALFARIGAALRDRRIDVRAIECGLVTLVGFGAVFSVRLVTHQIMYGMIWPPTTGAIYIQPWHPHPFLMLFSARSGLLTQTPLMWLAVVGFGLAFRKQPRALLGWFVPAFLVDFWVCSSPLDWTAGATVGPRLLTSFCGLFLVFSALSLDALSRFATARPGRLQNITLALWSIPSLLFSFQLIYGDPAQITVRYENAIHSIIDAVYEHIGNPLTLPGTLVFAARYGAHPKDFDRVAVYGVFAHDLHRGTVVPSTDRVRLASPPGSIVFVRGFAAHTGGRAVSAGKPGVMLVPLAWPYVSDVAMTVSRRRDSDSSCRLTVSNGLFFGRTRLGSTSVRSTSRIEVEVHAPAGAFDSGINEMVFESSCDVVISEIRFIDRTDHETETELTRRRRSSPSGTFGP